MILNFGITQERSRVEFSRQGLSKYRSLIAPPVQLQTKQESFDMKIWLGTNATIGQRAFLDGIPPDGVGVEYPIGSGLEHLYGTGVWIGTIVDTGSVGNTNKVYAVTTGYDWGAQGPRHEMLGHQTPRDIFYRASTLDLRSPNKRGFDDDLDGKIDEDELDGYDNDNDWKIDQHDLGTDGIPDSQETGCKGAYHPADNPDPAFDNYEPTKPDKCRPDDRGIFPRKNNKDIYTEKNGIPDHGEPNVDEDYAAISESDVSVAYTDLFREPVVLGHIPLGIKVWQKSYAWRSQLKEPIIPIEYYIINTGQRILDSVYIGYFVDPLIGLPSISNITDHKYAAYLADLRTGYAHNPLDRPATPIGVVLLGTPKPLDSLRYTFRWNIFAQNPGTDEEHYLAMALGIIKPDQPSTPGADTQFFFAFGPFDAIRPGDTLKIAVALISGDGVLVGLSPLKENAQKALALYNNGYRLPTVPPSPPLRVVKGSNRVTLEWDWREGDPIFDPIETWDDSNKLVNALPQSHWRRQNPPPGKSSGGRIFEGYRVWRSESPEYNPYSFTLLKQFDVSDDLHFEFQTGLEFRYVDTNLVRGRHYWYAVTSFSIPGASILIIPDPEGGPARRDTILTPYVESSLGQNSTLVQLPFTPSTRLGEVKVVPNPYRTDQNYTFEEGGWEGRGVFWTENERVVWFTHLPPKATIRVFSLTGDHVITIEHDDTRRGTPNRPEGQEEWDLLSESGRAIASGVYVFTVESEFGRQVGKFVIIR